MGEEKIEHALWGCKYTRRYWEDCGLLHILDPQASRDIVGYLMNVKRCLREKGFDFFLVLTWELWNVRNRVY